MTYRRRTPAAARKVIHRIRLELQGLLAEQAAAEGTAVKWRKADTRAVWTAYHTLEGVAHAAVRADPRRP